MCDLTLSTQTKPWINYWRRVNLGGIQHPCIIALKINTSHHNITEKIHAISSAILIKCCSKWSTHCGHMAPYIWVNIGSATILYNESENCATSLRGQRVKVTSHLWSYLPYYNTGCTTLYWSCNQSSFAGGFILKVLGIKTILDIFIQECLKSLLETCPVWLNLHPITCSFPVIFLRRVLGFMSLILEFAMILDWIILFSLISFLFHFTW